MNVDNGVGVVIYIYIYIYISNWFGSLFINVGGILECVVYILSRLVDFGYGA